MTDQLDHLLDQIDQLDQQATKGTWHTGIEDGTGIPYVESAYGDDQGRYIVADMLDEPDSAFIALSRTALPAMAKAVRGVLDVLDDYTMPSKLHDPTGIAGAELETLEQCIKIAIADALGGTE